MRHAAEDDGDGTDDERDWNSDDDDDAGEGDSSEALKKRFAAMDDDQRARFELFRSANCKVPAKWCVELMQRAVPPGVAVQASAGVVASHAVRLFVADLVETAKRLSDSRRPLTPDLVMVAYNEIESHGKIPGKGPGVKKHYFR
jgi:hypothetical protein